MVTAMPGSAQNPIPLPKGRLVSLDVFRGITIALMILVNNPGGSEYYGPLQHADWNGLTLADLVFPLFIFIMGVAIPYSLANRPDQRVGTRSRLHRIVRRTAVLFVLGLFINIFPYFSLPNLRVLGVLQRLALCYFFASIIFLFVKPRWRLFLTATLPLIYWALMALVPVPGYGAGVLSKEGNLAAYLDRLVLNGHLYAGTWDPEGILSTLPAISTALIGILTGQYLMSRQEPSGKARLAVNLACFGGLGLVIGFAWNLLFPVNKNLWSSSYVAVTGGMAVVSLAAIFYVVDVRMRIRWTKPFVILGMNAITVYVLSEIGNLALIYATVPLVSGNIALKSLIFERLFASWAGPLHGSFIYALAYLAFCWAIAAILCRKRIFLKI
jgi:predicted acyltransferase